MPRRNMATRAAMVTMVEVALRTGRYKVRRNVDIGMRFDVARHRIDAVAEDPEGRMCLVSMKWQQVGGTTEQKIPFEIICLADALMRDESFYKAYLVLGGEGWTFKEFYISGGLRKHLTNGDLVSVVSLDDFVARANRSGL